MVLSYLFTFDGSGGLYLELFHAFSMVVLFLFLNKVSLAILIEDMVKS